MNDEEYLKYCLIQIEEKLNWKDSSRWKEPDFLKLSEIISNSSKISISAHTLKRLYGKIKYSESYNPQSATKDALSKYLGFSNWEAFVNSNHGDQNKNKIKSELSLEKEEAKSNNISKKPTVILLVLSLFILVIFFMNQSQIQLGIFEFELKDSIGKVPHTVSVHYNIEEIKTDSVFIDYDFEHPVNGYQLIKPNKMRFINNFTYQIPGYYKIRLMRDKNLLTTKNVLALSDSWNSYLAYEGNIDSYWLDTEIKTTVPRSNLYYSTEDLIANGFDINAVFYITNQLYKQFEIDGDNFELETRFKNSEEIGGISCYDVVFSLINTGGTNYFRFVEKGCSRFSGIKIGENIINGVDEDLSDYMIDQENWNELKVHVQDKSAKVYLNGKLIYAENYSISNGRIIGIRNVFKGRGIIDYIQLKDLNTGKLFFEDFE